jgi:predicted transcriptional regulator
MKFEQSENFQVEQNKSLARQVEILKFHLERMNLKFAEDLKKLEQGEKVREWEFIDMAKMRVDENADLPVYTEEESLEVVNTSEYNIDIPVQESILLKNDRYAVHLCQKIENPSQVNKDLLLFELKKQVIQSNMVNCELGRSYFELLWKYKLLREKMNLRSKVIRSQKQRIITLESLVTSLNLSYSKLVEILEKLETKPIENHQESPFKRKMVRCVKPMCTIAPIRDNPLQDLQGLQSFQAFQALHGAQGPQAGIIKRQKSRRETVASNINLQSFRNSFQMSGANLNETYNKYLFLESNFQNQLMFNDSLKRSNEVITIERNSYKKLLDEFTRENHVIYLNEKNRWKGFLDDFKAVCETELVRKQVEINKLNQILANWMNRYMELEESVKGARVLNSAHKEQIQDLLGQTRIQVRPTKLQIFESPLHCRFKSMASTHVSNIDGDISPPSFE